MVKTWNSISFRFSNYPIPSSSHTFILILFFSLSVRLCRQFLDSCLDSILSGSVCLSPLSVQSNNSYSLMLVQFTGVCFWKGIRVVVINCCISFNTTELHIIPVLQYPWVVIKCFLSLVQSTQNIGKPRTKHIILYHCYAVVPAWTQGTTRIRMHYYVLLRWSVNFFCFRERKRRKQQR